MNCKQAILNVKNIIKGKRQLAKQSQSNYEAYLKRVESRLSNKINLERISKDASAERSTSNLASSHGLRSEMLTRSAVLPTTSGPLHTFKLDIPSSRYISNPPSHDIKMDFSRPSSDNITTGVRNLRNDSQSPNILVNDFKPIDPNS